MMRVRLATLSVALVLLVSAVALVLVAAPGRATTYPPSAYHFDGTVTGERSGTSTILMDLNGDGVADLVVGSPYNGTSSRGSVTFYLSAPNATGVIKPFMSAVTTFGWPGSLFGQSMANVGNFHGAGPVLVVGAPLASPNGLTSAGNLTFFYPSAGFDGTPRFWINSTNAGEELGYSVAAAGDMNGDGYADLVAGAPLGNGGNGVAYVYFGGSSPSVTPAMTFTTSSAGAHFGFSVAGNGSVDSNAALDIVVGAPDQSSSTGAAYVIRNLMGTGGSVNRTTVVTGVATGDHFGEAVALGDFNGDTFSDVAVGAPDASSGAGTVTVLNGGSHFNGGITMTLTGQPGESLGASVAAGNFHRDPYTDLLVGAPTSTINSTGVGRAYAFYGGPTLSSAPNLTLVPGTGDMAFGSSVSVGGDFNADGGPDFAVGDAQFTSGSHSNAGRTAVYAGTIVPTFTNPVILGWVCQPNTWKPSSKTCVGLAGFSMALLQAGAIVKTATTLANGSFSFTAVPGTYTINATLFPYISNSTSLTVGFNTGYTVLIFPLRTPMVYGIAKDAVNRTAFPGVTVALYNATGALVNATVTPGTPSRNYSIYIPTAFLPAVGASLGLTVKMWDATHYLNSTSVTVRRNQTVNGTMFLNRFPAISGVVRDVSTTLPVAGATIQLTQGAKVLATTSATNQGAYSLVAVNATVPNNVYFNVTASKYERTQLVLAVNQNTSYPQTLLLMQSDTIAPTSQISPLLTTFTNTAIVTVTATATDNYPNNVAQVQLYYRFNNTGNFAVWGADTTAPYVFSVNTTALSGDGSYAFYTIATDYGGNAQAKPGGNMTWTIVDTHKPNSRPAALPTYETQANFTITATAYDWNAIAQVALYFRKGTSGAYSLLSADTTSPYRWFFNTTLLGTGDGSYQFYTLATDAAGNVEAVPATADTQTTVDTTPPTLTVTAPTASQVVGTGWVNVTWTASDATSGIAKFDVKLDSGAWVHAGTKLYYNFTHVADGSHSVSVNATDLAGNSKTVTVAFTVSTITPVVAISTPASGAYVTSASVAVTWTVTNTGAGLASMQVRLDGGAWTTLAASATSYTFTSVADGSHTAYVQAVGLNGAQGVASVAITVDTTPPSLTVTAPTTNTWTKSTSVVVTYTVADPTSGVLRVMLSVDGGTAVNVTGVGNYTVANLVDGTHTISLTATDKAGNSGTVSVTVKVDTVPPVVTITAPTSGATLSADNVTISWAATDTGSGVSLTEVSVDGGAFKTVTGTSTSITGLANGNHTVIVRVTDAAGNQNTASVTFKVTQPTVAPPPGLDPLVIAAIALAVVVIVVALAAVLYMRRRKPKAPETAEPKPEEQPKKGGET